MFLESKVVHVWESKTDYVYTRVIIPLVTQWYSEASWCAMVNCRHPAFQRFILYIAQNCTLEIYNPNGSLRRHEQH